mgnify:CR=1 FL=1
MKITKELKNATFIYDEEKKVFTIMEQDGFHGCIELNKVYAFAFMRFVVRMAQRNWFRPFPKKEKKQTAEPLSQTPEDLNQVEFRYDQEQEDEYEVFLPEGYGDEDFIKN